MSRQHSNLDGWIGADNGWIETRSHCAYNQTRDSMLASRVVAGDFPFSTLASWMIKLTPDSEGGLWISPVRGLPTAIEDRTIDLMYLDADGRVLDLVESFPSCMVSVSSKPVTSVLALPYGAIFSSGTRRGDTLIIGVRGQSNKTPGITDEIGAHQLGRPKGKTLQFPGPVKQERADASAVAAGPSVGEPEKNIPHKESAKHFSTLRSRLARIFSPASSDQRKAHRKPIPGLVASFWTGGPPISHQIRDISSTGLFVVTTERWYLGTIIRMTLTKSNLENAGMENSICVCAEAVRWGNDGVGLRFLLENNAKKLPGQEQQGADREQLDRFLECVQE